MKTLSLIVGGTVVVFKIIDEIVQRWPRSNPF